MSCRGNSVAWAGLVLGCVAMMSCGRINFDQSGGDCVGCGPDADTCQGPSCRAFDPRSPSCLAGNDGPFVQRAQRIVMDGYSRGVWYARPYVVAAQADNGVATLRFDGQSFVEVDSLTGIGWILSTWNDGDILYVVSSGVGVLVYRLESDGKLTFITQETTVIGNARHVWTNGSRLFATGGPDGLFAFDLAGSALTQVGTRLPSANFALGGWWDGTYHYFADNTSLRVLTFDGSTFMQLDTSTGFASLERVWGDGKYVYAAHAAGVSAFSFDGSTLALLDTATHGSTKGVWSDGQHIFTASDVDGLRAYTFDGASFASVDHVSTTEALDVYGDGTYVYLADGVGNVIAYSGFECLSY